jgi:hypothetical protein
MRPGDLSMFKPGRVLFAATFAVALCAGCSRPEPLAFSPFPGATAVIVNNARGAYHPLTVRDANTISRLVAIMDRYRDGWSANAQSRFGTGGPITCAYGIGFFEKQHWVGGVSIETDGTTVARSQYGTGIVYKSDTTMGREMLAALRL